ncbi:mechanosensitive ion channel domain-containing protein [uncultured Parvimonas sp.]|uniref:mechanosensitive ion channel family protein n=1 Tax=uncultured Parvimonas sp. TaxID=747372 RepID=UPI002889B0DE|nr:mechanosensitive ion channel domain-containing protein [uncultured Parvimonas sp.]
MNKIFENLFYSDSIRDIFFKVVLSIIVFLVAKVVIYFFTKIFKNLVKTYKTNDFRNSKKVNSIVSISSSVFKYIIYFIVIVIILSIFNVNTLSLIATAGVGGIIIAFGVQSIIKDLFSGIFILLDDQYNIGDDVIINDIAGNVITINMRNTQIQGYDGSLNTISNGSITKVTNLSKNNQRSIVTFCFPTDVDIEKVKKIISDFSTEFPEKHKSVIKAPVFFGVTEMESYYVKIGVVFWSKQSTQWQNEKILREELYKEFKEKNIEFLKFEKGDKIV